MKRFYIFFIMIFLFACTDYGIVFVENDEFKNESKVLVKELLDPHSKLSPANSCEVLLVKRIPANAEPGYELFFNLNRKLSSHRLQQEAYLKIGEEKYAVEPQDVLVRKRNQVSENTERVMQADSSFQDVVTGVTETTWFQDQFKIDLTTEQADAMSKANECSFRFYLGSEGITFVLNHHKLNSFKKVLAHEGTAQK